MVMDSLCTKTVNLQCTSLIMSTSTMHLEKVNDNFEKTKLHVEISGRSPHVS